MDLVRCTTSIFLAAEQWKLTPTSATTLAHRLSESVPPGHSRRDPNGGRGRGRPANGHGAIWELLGSTASGIQESLLEQNTKRKANGKLIIRRTDKFTELSRKRFEAIREAIEAYGQAVEAAGVLPGA